MGGFQMPSFPSLGPSQSSMPSPSDPFNKNSAYGGFSYASPGPLPGTNQNLITPTIDPALTNQMLGYTGSQIGQGLPAFNQQVNLPGGGTTQPGQLSAPLNPILQSLQQFMSGQGGPGNLPGVLPMWQSEMTAMQQPIQENLANLKEQFGSMGALGSSELGSASMDYLSQTSADEMALLTSATQSSLPTMASAGMDIQGVNQAAIQSQYNQFQTDLPQNNPMLPYEQSMAQMMPGQSYQKQPSTMDNILSNLGGLVGLGGAAANAAFPNMPGWLSILLGG
jgi:hypothetical protein